MSKSVRQSKIRGRPAVNLSVFYRRRAWEQRRGFCEQATRSKLESGRMLTYRRGFLQDDFTLLSYTKPSSHISRQLAYWLVANAQE